MRGRAPFLTMNRTVNPALRTILRSRAHRLASGRFALITYTGRRSGREYTIPVFYRDKGDEVTIAVGWPERKVWWRNLTGKGGAVRLVCAARSCAATPSPPESPGAMRWFGCGSNRAADVRMAQLIEDPVFRYRIRLSRVGEVLRGEFWVDPGGGGLVDHFHPRVEERFEVIEGEVTANLAGEERTAVAGDRFTIPAGTRHRFRNSGNDVAHLVVEMEPAMEMEQVFEESAALARARRWTLLGRRGVPRGPRALLEMADYMDRYRETIVLASPPRLIRRLLIPPLARIERWRRRRDGRSTQ